MTFKSEIIKHSCHWKGIFFWLYSVQVQFQGLCTGTKEVGRLAVLFLHLCKNENQRDQLATAHDKFFNLFWPSAFHHLHQIVKVYHILKTGTYSIRPLQAVKESNLKYWTNSGEGHWERCESETSRTSASHHTSHELEQVSVLQRTKISSINFNSL